MEQLTNLSWTAVGIASLASFILGNVWFHPGVFGLTWANAAGVELKMSVLAFVGTLIATILGCVGLAFVLRISGYGGLGAGLALGLLFTLAFVLPAILGQWVFMGKWKLFAVNMGFNLLNLLMTGAILGYFQPAARV